MYEEYDAVVYDLDGTLVHLDVDWAAVEGDLRDVLGVDDPDATAWNLLDEAERTGRDDAAERVLSGHEREGAERSTRLPDADGLPLSVPTGVCSLNCEAAVRLALDRHGLAEHVDAVVGRDSVATRKPDAEPLLATLRELDVAPEDAVFVGDSRRDELTAERAGTAFVYVEGTAPDGD